jgi:ubiquinone/menaquinone biosynthesis C-methylase UbiE
MATQKTAPQSAQERAYIYDLYVVPGWREVFDQMLDEEVKLPDEGRFLDAECGTGGYAVDLAARLGAKGEVVGVDESPERIALARAKAEVKKLDTVSFDRASLEKMVYADETFDFVIADLSLVPPGELPARAEAIWRELRRVARPGAQVVVKLATRGSFDEFHSVLWEALYESDLTEYTPQLEELIAERPTVDEAEEYARAAGLRKVSSVTRKHRFDFADAETFLQSPLIESEFLAHWLAIFDNERDSSLVRQELEEVIDRARAEMDFDVSIKATLIIAER